MKKTKIFITICTKLRYFLLLGLIWNFPQIRQNIMKVVGSYVSYFNETWESPGFPMRSILLPNAKGIDYFIFHFTKSWRIKSYSSFFEGWIFMRICKPYLVPMGYLRLLVGKSHISVLSSSTNNSVYPSFCCIFDILIQSIFDKLRWDDRPAVWWSNVYFDRLRIIQWYSGLLT